MATPNPRALFTLCACLMCASPAAADDPMAFAHDVVAAHPGQSGAYVLDSGEEALIARAWLADHAQRSIDVQYFIWSTDNIGILAAEAILRAAERGVHARILVDDLLIDAPDKSLLALAKHPNIEIRIYNPNTSVGVPLRTRVWNALTDFRGINQRMHTTRPSSSTAPSRSRAAATRPRSTTTTTRNTASAIETRSWRASW